MGIRRDSLSPYLFVLVMERLSAKVHELDESRVRKPIRVARDGPPISDLFFADDVLLFCLASTSQVHVVADVLHNFCDNSDLKIYMGKSNAKTSKEVSRQVVRKLLVLLLYRLSVIFGDTWGFPWLEGESPEASSTI